MKLRWLLIGAILLLAIQTVVQVRLASTDSQTTDEAVHLSAGYTYLTRGDWRFNPEHPPLVKVLAALPLLAVKPHVTASMETYWEKSDTLFYDSWRENRAFGEELLYKSGNNPDQLLFYGRLPMVFLTLLLGLTIFLITLKHWGDRAALVSTALYVFNPIVNGHGHLITTDIAISLGYLLSVYSFWQLLTKPTWLRAVYWALAFGGALLVKHTAIILIPAFVLLLVVAAIRQRADFNWKQFLLKSVVGLLIVWALLWAGFGFNDRVAPKTVSVTADILNVYKDTDQIASLTNMARLDQAYRLAQPILALLPANYIKGVLLVTSHASGGHSSYLLGEVTRTGWWYYFPILMLLKTPLAMLLVFGGAIYVFVRGKPKESLIVGLLTSVVVFLVAAIYSKANLGIRHILPIFPLLMITSGWAFNINRKFRLLTWGLLAWLAIVSIVSYPTYLGYFNELSGKPSDNYKIATDSNLDWGQDIKRIKRYIDQNNLSNVYIGYSWNGQAALDYYLGKNSYQLLETWRSGQGGVAIIGASALAATSYPNMPSCPDRRFITNGTFACSLEDL